MDIKLEEFTQKSELLTKKLLDFCELGWSANILKFYKRKDLYSKTLSFNFFSHKVLRWLGPILILIIWISSLILGLTGNLFYFTLFLCCTFLLVILPLFDFYLEGLGVHQRHLRFVRYFVVMNIAILMGFIKFLQGIQSGTWEPPKRETK